jgi:hypothetical protein
MTVPYLYAKVHCRQDVTEGSSLPLCLEAGWAALDQLSCQIWHGLLGSKSRVQLLRQWEPSSCLCQLS